MELNFESSDLHVQLELLKEKLKNKEKEITVVLQSQKEEYERNLRERDDEVNQFVDNLVKENLEFKKTIISLEIDLEMYKEKLLSTTSESDDKIFYDNLKQIKESKESKQKEIIDKYDKYNKTLQKEVKQALSNLKKLAYENKQKILMGEEYDMNNSNTNTNNNENLVSMSGVEEHFSLFENRIKVLHEELNNKEKYCLVIEQKYEMTNEENRMIKRKLQEERANILKMIEEIQQENSSAHQQLMGKINSEIYEKKHHLEREINNSLSRTEESIRDLISAKARLTEELQIANEKLSKLTSELTVKKSELDKLEKILIEKEKEISEFEEIKSNLSSEISELTMQLQILKKGNEDLTVKLNDSVVKVATLETANKLINDNINREIEKCEQRNKIVIDNQNNDIISLTKQIRELKNKLEEQKDSYQRDQNKLKETNNNLEVNSGKIEKLSSDLREKEMNMKMAQNAFEDMKEQFSKLSGRKVKLEEEIGLLQEENKKLKEKLAENEIENTAMKNEIVRVSQLKDEFFGNFEEAKKSNVFLNTQLETLKMTNNIEIQRLKNQIAELDKVSEKFNKLSANENANVEVRRELRDFKQLVAKVYKTFINKINSLSNSNVSNIQYEEAKMLEEIEPGFDKLISLSAEKTKLEASVDPKLVEKYEEEIKGLKKKINTVMQITNSVSKCGNNTGNNSAVNSNNAFKSAEKDNANSLYESVIIHLKNLNLKHLLEIFQLNMQREEEIRSLLGSNNNTSSANKKQLSELTANFTNLKKLCEQAFQDHQSRAKLYIQPEEFEKRLEEYKIFTQSLIDMVLDTLMSYKLEVTDAIVFKMPINDYNHFIEHISQNLDAFNKKVNMYIETYNKNSSNVEKAVDALVKNTNVDYDLLNNLIAEKFI